MIFSVSFSPTCELIVPVNVDVLGDDYYKDEVIEGPVQVILDKSNLTTDVAGSNWKWIIRANTDQ